METNADLRELQWRYFWQPGETTVDAQQRSYRWLAMRGDVVAFSADGATVKDPRLFAQRMSDYSARLRRSHLHGVLVAGSAFYSQRAITGGLEHPDAFKMDHTTTAPVAAFKWSLLHSLARFDRFPSHWTPLSLPESEEG